MARLQIGIGPAQTNRCIFINYIHNQNPTRIEVVVSSVTYTGPTAFDAGYIDSDYNAVATVGMTRVGYYCFLQPATLDLNQDASSYSMKATWTDGADVTSLSVLSLQNLSVNLGAKTATFNFNGPTTSNSILYFNITSGGDPPKNVKIFNTDQETDLNAGYHIDSQHIARYSQFAIIRCMDYGQTNGCAAVDYADLPDASFPFWLGSAITSGQKVGVPVDFYIEMANRTNRPIWITIPHQFTDSAVTSLATDLFNGITWSPGMKVYVEYSNEYWNSGFSQTTYVQTQGTGVGWTTGSNFDKGQQWGGWRQSACNQIFRSVFGEDSGGKWVGVLGTQLANTGVTNSRITGINRYVTVDAPVGTTLNKLFGYLSVAPYFGPVPSTALSGIGATLAGWATTSQTTFNDNLYAQLYISAAASGSWLNLAQQQVWWLSQKTIADTNSLSLSCYEGG